MSLGFDLVLLLLKEIKVRYNDERSLSEKEIRS